MQSVLVFRGVVFVCFVQLILSSDATMRSAMTCAQRGDVTVELQCSVNERIHVKEEWYGDGATNPCRFQSNGSCRDVLQTSRYGLAVNCNGEQTCNETVSSVTCNLAAPAAAAEVHYKCINDSMDICGFDTINAATNKSVYLHSPGYPYSLGLNKSCVVRITGKVIQVTLVEQRLNGGNLIISGKDYKKWSNVNIKLYNRKLTEQYSEVAISYIDRGNDRSNVWISVVGSSPMSVTFNGGMITTSAASTLLVPMSEGSSLLHDVSSQKMSVTQSVMPRSTISPDTQTLSTKALFTIMGTDTDTASVTDTDAVEMTSKTTVTTMTIAPTTTSVAGNSGDVVIALSVVCGILVLIIVVFVVYVMMVKHSRNSSSTGTSVHYAVRSSPRNGPQIDDGLSHPSANINTNSSLSRHENANVYAGIQRNTSDAGDEHNYGHITSSEGPCYANSVSGDDPYVNT
ncbi:uncharacterized protein LOC124265004 [Haliotis rubra]|uniref:uncharacterized protein LOC124265004 n=1 Tax=Haliotis rubra TaxID=36100 RepID=UPI001EE614E0|nr:uncharacterized protein LOC124265004 [Haliotis rubra]